MNTHRIILFFCIVSVLSACHKKVFHYAYEHHENMRIDQKIVALDSTTHKMILPYKAKLDAQMNAVIGYNVNEMVKAKPTSTLTNFIADAVVYSYQKISGIKVDAAILNYGGLRINTLGKGDITVGEVYEIMPFENQLVIIKMKSEDVRILANRIAKTGGWPISKGTSFTFKDSIAMDIVINDRPLENNKIYTIAFPDYVANGGDNTDFLKTMPREDTGLLVRDLILMYVKDTKQIMGDETMRISKIN